MITTEENELLTRIGPGTPMGRLMRRNWHPVAALAEMRDRWTKRVRILGEDLVLFKDRQGRFGLIAEQCPHRRASLAYGIPQEDGIRCPYHGWKFDGTGRCIEQPNEPEGSAFKDKVWTSGYPVQELAGMLFGYLGPQPAPLIPALDGYVVEGTIRMVGRATVRCNWLQIMENSVDPVHTEWLHGKLYEFLKEKDGIKVAIGRHHLKVAFDEFDYGIIKRRLMEGQSEDCSDWTVGHPIVFPNLLAVGANYGHWDSFAFQIRVPIDDETTEHYWYNAFLAPPGSGIDSDLLDDVPYYNVPIRDANGEYLLEYTHVQDIMAWETQGAIADRSQEHLGSTDRGVTLLRKMLQRELKNVDEGRDPMCVVRDPAKNRLIKLPTEHGKDMNADGFEAMFRRNMSGFAPIADRVIDAFKRRKVPVSA